MTLICDYCGHSFTDKDEFMNHKCTPMRKQEQQEMDEEEFKEWLQNTKSPDMEKTILGYSIEKFLKTAFLAGRRTLREKENK